jgi:hypothetical protein
MTTNQKLQDILKNVDRFKGVYLYDQLDLIPHLEDGCIIVNYVTQEEVQDGKIGHYVVIDNRQNLEKNDDWLGCMFFDPYGLPPDFPRVIMNLPNTKNISRFLRRILLHGSVKDAKRHLKINHHDFQVEQPWDNLCGVYSALFVENPNFDTNPIFYTRESRIKLDHDLEHLYRELHVLGNPYIPISEIARKVMEHMSRIESEIEKTGIPPKLEAPIQINLITKDDAPKDIENNQ